MTNIVQINLTDLEEIFRRVCREETEKQRLRSELVTLNEAAKRLKVSRATMLRWEKANYLVPVRIGTRVRYRVEDINRIGEETGRC